MIIFNIGINLHSEREEEHMRILFIDIDTLRPDHMGCYGYMRNTTPNIDSIAEDGIRFDNYYCSDAPCLPSRAALVSGMFGIRNGAVGHGGTAADRRLTGEPRGFRDYVDDGCLHNIFRHAGMHTASISTFAERHSSWWFNAGFNECYNVGKTGMESGEEVLPVVLDWLDRNEGKDNWYLHIHLWDPHTPYRAPKEFGNPFENEPFDEGWLTEDIVKKHLEHVGPHCLNELNMFDDGTYEQYPRMPGKAENFSEVRRVIDGYDCGVRFADELIGKVIAKLREQGIYDDMAIILSSDHGENMGELGIYGEHATADEPTCHIPFIMKWPGGVKGVDKGFHYSLDLLPTMAELLNAKKYDHWDGESYAKAVTDGEDCSRDSLVVSQMAHVCQRSARFGDWLYIRTVHDGFHLFDDEMLFNIKNDPHEQFDVKEENPLVCAQGAKIILDWHDEMMKKSDSEIDPMWTVMREGGPEHTRGYLDDYLKRLEATGRSEGAEKLRKKYKK